DCAEYSRGIEILGRLHGNVSCIFDRCRTGFLLVIATRVGDPFACAYHGSGWRWWGADRRMGRICRRTSGVVFSVDFHWCYFSGGEYRMGQKQKKGGPGVFFTGFWAALGLVLLHFGI